MKMTLEELAKIAHEQYCERIKMLPITQPPAWEEMPGWNRGQAVETCKVILDHLASMEVPSVEELNRVYERAPGQHGDSITAVRNAIATPLVAKIAALEAKLEAVKALPENWRSKFNGVPTVQVACCIKEIEAALSTPAPQVPEAKEVIPCFECDGTLEPTSETGVLACPECGDKVWREPQHHQPPAGLVLHNPDNLTPEQVGPDNRLLCTVELDGRHKDVAEMFVPGRIEWHSCNANKLECTYRVPISTPWPEVKTEEKPESTKKTWTIEDLKAAAEAGKWMQFKDIGGTWWIPEKKADWYFERLAPLGRLRALETTVHDGKTYFDHRPGDEMPVGGDVEIMVLHKNEACGPISAGACYWEPSTTIQGYYPTSLALALGNVEKSSTTDPFIEAVRHAPTAQSDTFKQDGVEWIAHKPGDPCPVDEDTAVEVLRVDGTRLKSIKPSLRYWGDGCSPSSQIKGYRLVSQPEQDKPDALAVAQDRIKELEAIIASSIDQLNLPGTTPDNLALSINAKIMQRDEWHSKTILERDKLKGYYDAIVEECRDDQVLKRLREMTTSRDDWKSRHDSIKRQADTTVAELMRKNLTLADRSHELERMLPELQSQLTESWQKNGALESRLAALTPRSVAVKPTKEDAIHDDEVILIVKNGWMGGVKWDSPNWKSPKDHWLGWLSPAAIMDLLPKPEDKERAEFEKRFPNMPKDKDSHGLYFDRFTSAMWDAWQARAGKDSAK